MRPGRVNRAFCAYNTNRRCGKIDPLKVSEGETNCAS